MVSKVLRRLINEAIVPAFLLVAVKLVSVVAVISFLGLSWEVAGSSFWPQILFQEHRDFVLVSSWSNFLTLLVVGLGLIWLVIKARYFHDTHISPRFTLKLLQNDWTSLLTSTVEISQKSVIWLSYYWLLVIFASVQLYLGYFYLWMFGVVFLLGLVCTWLLIADLEREFDLI